MVHYSDRTMELVNMPKAQRKMFSKIVNLDKENFSVKIADLGFSK